jgi:alkanesulfonate monooxygenase SsuD/methylene tetrahydromethanopterin reductase-like flavin-dependent oxidoreductase (luciferase family)
MHVLNHHGRFFKVRGPLSVACMPQGHPVIVQAGASEQGRELGAATADVIYAINGSLDAARAYYADVKGRMGKYGREPDELKIMPAFCPVVGGTRAEAQAKFDQLQELVDTGDFAGESGGQLPDRYVQTALHEMRIGKTGGADGGTISTDPGSDNGAPVGSASKLRRQE